ncbi:unnamed protein product, partial [Timema podura]|nr:unnamed protein product [Timema podura]
ADSQKKGLPWTFGKGFDTACPVSRFVSVEELKDPSDVNIWLKVNGRKIQDANTSDLAFTIPELIASITRYITLEPGDLILTVPEIRAYEAVMHGKPTCADCGQEAHDTCASTKFCVNCKGPHSAWSWAFPKWKAKKTDLEI